MLWMPCIRGSSPRASPCLVCLPRRLVLLWRSIQSCMQVCSNIPPLLAVCDTRLTTGKPVLPLKGLHIMPDGTALTLCACLTHCWAQLLHSTLASPPGYPEVQQHAVYTTLHRLGCCTPTLFPLQSTVSVGDISPHDLGGKQAAMFV